MTETVETITSDDGRYRVRIVHDEHATEPYDDGGSPVVRIWPDRYGDGVAKTEQVRNLTSYRVDGAIETAAAHFAGEPDKLERYLRMFHGTTVVRWHDTNAASYVTFDTAHWREVMGLTDEYMAKHPEIDWPASLANMDEYRAWLEGETYGWIGERLDTWTNATTGETREDWEHVDSCSGFYGLTDYLRGEATDAMSSFAEVNA